MASPDWEAAAKRLGFESPRPHFLRGVRNGRDVIVDAEWRYENPGDGATLVTRVRVKLPLAAERLQLRQDRRLDPGDLTTGDPAFDGRFSLGPADHVPLAPLCRDVRARLTNWAERGLSVSNGWFLLEGEASLGHQLSRLDQLVELANDLDVTDEPAQLALMAESDQVSGVRVRALQTLQQKFPRHDATRKAAAGGLTDPDPVVRRVAYTLFIHLESPQVVQARLPAALADPDAGVRAIAMPLVPIDAGSELFDAILSCVDLSNDTLDVAVAGTLSKLGNANAEPALLRLLERDSTEVRRAAAEALGTVGTLGAVEPLLKCTEGFRTPASLKEVARESVRRIQSRAGSADAGRLSISQAAEESGALSLATEGGELSVVDAKARNRA